MVQSIELLPQDITLQLQEMLLIEYLGEALPDYVLNSLGGLVRSPPGLCMISEAKVGESDPLVVIWYMHGIEKLLNLYNLLLG